MTDILEGFNMFLGRYPEKIAQEMLPSDQLQKITTTVSAGYGQFLEEHGIAGFKQGLFWSVNPLDYTAVVSDFLLLDPNEVHVVARTAFGDLFLWDGKGILLFQVNKHELSGGFLGESIQDLYNITFFNLRVADWIFRQEMFKEALERLGPLTYEECYGYLLAPSLGGAEGADNLQKVKLIPYLLEQV